MQKLKIILCLLVLLQTNAMKGQGSSQILHDIKQLNQFGRVLYIAAHPDDENTRVITYLTQKAGYQTAYLSLTRGDGGQNLIGSEQGTLLGLIRSLELVEARKIDGAKQFFTRAYDFGYSKNPEETLKIWNKDSVLKDVVWIIRSYKPDIIINRFPTTGEGGHGHHTASALLSEEAFEKAADPNYWPEQVALVGTWQATRVLWNTFQFGDRNTTAEDQFKITCGAYLPFIGKSVGEIAAESRSKHASQGFGTAPNPKAFTEYFKYIKGKPLQYSLMEQVDTSWSSCIHSKSNQKKLQKIYNQLIRTFNHNSPYHSIPHLVAIQSILQEEETNTHDFNSSVRIRDKLDKINSLIAQCAGISIYCNVQSSTLVPGDSFSLSFGLVCRNPEFTLQKINLSNLYSPPITPQSNVFDTLFKSQLPIDLHVEKTQGYWLHKPPVQGLFAFTNYTQNGQALSPDLLYSDVYIQLKNIKQTLQIRVPWKYRYVDPSKGEETQPVFIAPPISITPSQSTFFYNPLDSNIKIQIPLVIKHFKKTNTSYRVALNHSGNWSDTMLTQNVEFRENETEKVIYFQLIKKQKGLNVTQETISFTLNALDTAFTSYKINYPHLPQHWVFSPTEIKLIPLPIDNKTRQSFGKIGYIEGAGDKVAQTLFAMGLEVTVLQDSQLMNLNFLQQFKVIITGVRAYNTREALRAAQPILLEYIKNGGRIVVQYNTQNRIGPLIVHPGPYPFEITRDRITDETAIPHILIDKHPIWQTPFKITENDFEGWVQERGIYFAGNTHATYQKPLAFQDPNEPLLDGGIISCNFGNGSFVYTGLSFFRQIPQGNLGSIHLFLNLLFYAQPTTNE